MTNVLVLGGSGMLGSMVVDVLARAPEFTVTATVRNTALADRFRTLYPNVRWALFDGRNLDRDRAVFDRQAWIVNAIGITKPLIHDDNPAEIETAIAINSILPHRVGRCAADRGATVLQIATDCVYSGTKGGYVESDAHDALDAYGKTKSLGETYIPSVHHLRCSIVGPEPKDFKFLVEWFLRQPRGARVSGFVNHRWNGVTTLHLARLCLGAIRHRIELPHLQHLVPSGCATKAEMLHHFARAFGRGDIAIDDVEAKTVVDRTLSTRDVSLNAALWSAAGYEQPPTVGEMIAELARHDYRAQGRGAAA
jgi:dTDP-4-dehydrorhamnose reductase